MSCADQAILGQTFTFTLQAFSTSGAPVDTDALPAYSIYEDETATAILTGTMAKLDDAGTTGFYSEQIAISSANGFELWKTYSIRYAAAIAGTSVAALDTFNVVQSALAATTTTGALTTTANFKDYTGITVSTYDALIEALIVRATSAIEAYCDRTLRSTTYRQRYDGTGTTSLLLREYPVTAITLLSNGVEDVLKINNGSSDAYGARATVDVTNLTLTISGGASAGSDVLTLANYTAGTLAIAIAVLGKGWTGEVIHSDFSLWSAAELLPVMGLNCLNNVWAYCPAPCIPEDDYTVNADTGELYLPVGFTAGRQNVVAKYTAGYVTTPAALEQICIDLVNTYYLSRTQDTTVQAERLGDHSITYAQGGARDMPAHIAGRLAPYCRIRLPIFA